MRLPDLDVLRCPGCQGRMSPGSTPLDGGVAEGLLHCLGYHEKFAVNMDGRISSA